MEKPMYNVNDMVIFKTGNNEKSTYTGQIKIINRFGTFFQDEEPSYDIFVENYSSNKDNPRSFVKHVRESLIIGKVEY